MSPWDHIGCVRLAKRVIRLNKNTEYEREWNALKAEFEQSNLDDENTLKDITNRAASALKGAIDSEQEYWTLDRAQPIYADYIGNRLFIKTKSERWYPIAEHTIRESMLGILIDEADNVKHHTPMLIGAGTQASYIIGLHNCLLGRPISVNERWLP